MSEGFAYLDILFFAMVAAFIALRLRSVLGRRTGQERRRPLSYNGRPNEAARDANVVRLPERAQPRDAADQAIADLKDGPVKEGLMRIRAADRRFDLDHFLVGARTAFEMVVEAFAAGDKETLRPLLADEVYASFARAIDERAASNQSLETNLFAIKNIEVDAAEMRGSRARVTVRVTSEQSNVIRDARGEILEGEPDGAETVVDLWTFERNAQSSDPNWELVETRVPAA